MVHILRRPLIAGIEPIAVMTFLPATLLGYTQAAPTPDAVYLLVIDSPAKGTQYLCKAAIAISPVLAFTRLLADSFGQRPVLLGHLLFVTLCTAVLSKALACLSLTDSQLLDDLFDGLSARSRAHQFFDATSLRMAFSRAWSATTLRKRALSFCKKPATP